MEANLLSYHQRLSLKHAIFTDIPSSNPRKNKRLVFKKRVCAKRGDSDDDDDTRTLVDENMIVLRMRIKKMEASQIVSKEGDDAQLPLSGKNLKEWEKKTIENYQDNVCETMENLWSYFLKTRPSVALGLLALAAMTVPLSSSAAMENVLKVVKGLLAGCHVCIDIEF